MRVFHVLALFLVLFPGMAQAGEADVIEVRAKLLDDNTHEFYVTVLHADEGLKHYANKWDVFAPDATVTSPAGSSLDEVISHLLN